MPSSECSRFTTKVRIMGNHPLRGHWYFSDWSSCLSPSRNTTHSFGEIKNRPKGRNNDSRTRIPCDFCTCLTLREGCDELSFLWESPLFGFGVEKTQGNCVRSFCFLPRLGLGSGVWVVFPGLWSVLAPCGDRLPGGRGGNPAADRDVCPDTNPALQRPNQSHRRRCRQHPPHTASGTSRSPSTSTHPELRWIFGESGTHNPERRFA